MVIAMAVLGLAILLPVVTAEADERAAVQEQLILVPPPEPQVRPEITPPVEMDADRNGVDDLLQVRLRDLRNAIALEQDAHKRAALISKLDEPVRVELVFSRQITQPQINAFLALGAKIDYIYRAVSYGWNGTIALQDVERLPAIMGGSFVVVVADREARMDLDEATRTGRVRPVWAAGFAGNSAGYSGSSSVTIGILDSGVDDSHPDLAGRMQFWKDYTDDAEANPRDIVGHGSHVAGIALGSGAAGGDTTSTLFYTDMGNLAGASSGNGFLSPIHLPDGVSVTFNSTATWLGGGSTGLSHTRRDNGSTGNLTLIGTTNTGSSPLSESNTFTALASRQYQAFLQQNNSGTVGRFAIANNVTYTGVGDGFNTLRGVAPLCKWAGGKVFKNDGSGSITDIKEAIDDFVTKRITHNIKIVNMSLSVTGGGIDTTLRDKVNSMVNNGILAVCSAGNNGPTGIIADPGRAGKALTVAASNDINELTSYTSQGFSSPGTTEDLKPDIMAPGGSDFFSNVLSVDPTTPTRAAPPSPTGRPTTIAISRARRWPRRSPPGPPRSSSRRWKGAAWPGVSRPARLRAASRCSSARPRPSPTAPARSARETTPRWAGQPPPKTCLRDSACSIRTPPSKPCGWTSSPA